MNDYAHLRLHEATIRGTMLNAGHRRTTTRPWLATLSTQRRRRDTPSRTSAAAARRASQVRPA